MMLSSRFRTRVAVVGLVSMLAVTVASAAHGATTRPSTSEAGTPHPLLRYEPADDGVHTNYVIKSKWDHTDLTYSFVNHSRQLTPDRDSAAIRQAFDLWQ